MKILIATAQVPFIRGGAEILAEGLLSAIRATGHEAEITAIPFKGYPPERVLEQMLACRLLDVTESEGAPVDFVIGLKFPAYLVPHPNKVLWLLHQFRTAYELWDHPYGDLHHFPNGAQVRDAIVRIDQWLIPEAKTVFTISKNVSSRLWKYCGIDSTPLYHPPANASQFYAAAAEDYFFFPSRLTPLKRQVLVLEALAHTQQPVRVRLAGTAEGARYGEELEALARELRVEHRVEKLGQVTEEAKRALYAHALGVIFPPVDEDYGYVTLEAMLASKPVITCRDSGGPLEFVRDGETGLVADACPEALALAMDTLWGDRGWAKELGEAGRARYDDLEISWRTVVERLVSCV
jgi:glycosyltransferase involved in cell wall biosynthesis